MRTDVTSRRSVLAQGAPSVRLSGVVVPMGSLLSHIAVTVTANVPDAREGAAVRVRTARPWRRLGLTKPA
jgi:hypothetical protein